MQLLFSAVAGESETAPDFTNDEAGAQRWLRAHWRLNPWWCARHWLPALTDGGDVAVAMPLLAECLPALMPRRLILFGSVDEKNAWLFNFGLVRPICCRVGEEKIGEIWAAAGAQSSRR